LFINIAYIFEYLVNSLRVGGEDGCNLGVNLLEVEDVDLGELSVPVAVPVVPLLLALLGVLHLALLQVVVELLDCLALEDLQELFYQVDYSVGYRPQVELC
jgi:hypothetical protein